MEFAGQYPAAIESHLKSNWAEFVEVCHSTGTPDSPDTLPAKILQKTAKLWAGSDFAFEQCLKHPDLLFSPSEHLAAFSAGQHHSALEELIDSVTNEADLIQKLRIYRNRQMVRIIWRDLNRLASMQETTADLSEMADACVDKALQWLYDDACKTLGTPMGAMYGEEPEPQKMVVLGMGKLGANELNLSSDIDLMFTYPNKGETKGGRRALDNQEFFNRLGQRLIKVIDSKTADGFVFRVDMRLRPYGSSGSLSMSFSAMEQYYQDQGRDWERYAMIKARAIAGDLDSGHQLLDTLKPFTFRKYIDFSAIDSLRDMKKLIQREVKRKGMEGNIKLGPGGIREVEFIVQSFQLIHGGRDWALQQKSLLTVLEELKVKEYLPASATDELRAAYIYLRNLEHAIQALQDKQTQQLPIDNETLDRLAFSMGQRDWSELLSVLDDYREKVTQHFDDVVADPEDSTEEQTAEATGWHLLWMGHLSEEEELNQFEKHGFHDSDSALSRFKALRDGKAITRVRRVSRERLDDFIPHLLVQISDTESPDTALSRLLPLIESVLRRTAYLVLLMENPGALEHLIKLCTASPWIADEISRYPALLDEFLNIDDLYNPPKRNDLEHDLRQQLAHIPEDDLEAQMEVLRHFKMGHVLKVAASQAAGTLPLMKESDYLTWIAEVLLEQVVDIAWKNMVEKHGYPVSKNGQPCNPGFAIIGYGKLGGIELGPGSDLDLVFIHDGNPNKPTDGQRPLDGSMFFTRLGQRIIHILTTQTPSGRLYEVDMRLRPSGASGMLVSSLEAFEKYQRNEAWTWEHQALVRARAVAGDKELTEKFEKLRRTILATKRELPELKAEVIKMRNKMHEHLTSTKLDATGEPMFHLKHGEGGIVDIEFLMQYAVLAHANSHADITEFTDNVRISESLEKAEYLSEQEGYDLREAYKFLRKAAHSRAFLSERSFVPVKQVEPLTASVTELWKKWLGK
ncbi:bifunctional [glutamate--ammonia ligase]-adenylyl-L-tyrosine phosphorylase/[glutamate--ammonia-ligase] adenylyltransferase [Endozoicomonas sp. OPT23]|uniref:bifunctional [glutamate--ammonia ligase]-adenylyl-L-tyrosine phosphorylase/[glutamate--ammonia-ligase] adenylyltransferase n=1 Tax=Endozoicomonas sp. OPT23 TaxID=2072845 RepID=UPI00129A4955|nr:bifunctional [glutamate--ammonia ligase]-adenylyl-L-tyrosine phosphorylase/[glutamate--ammonia-ligase] adenylyltransferase [Endozoicomonas sp. OPT23]MRI31626.1 bifunctional [glutamate--ammonia ligase]-adenylyl-L-tyrosine phosphorylase/[glutamate--ammonia-ligase] adenylyltransferase [Endozoicomonas sp. OPT23]